MLDEYSQMEKKPNGRAVQSASKPGGTECKKVTDTINKPFGKYTRRREPNVYFNYKNEQQRKCNPSKGGKFADKRPKPHHEYNGGKEDSKVAFDGSPEYGSIFSPGRKNLNHLLNFHYAPRVVSKSAANWSQSTSQNWFATHKHKYNKENFLQANCQFVVKEEADYSLHFVDPDLLVDWNQIEQIRFKSGALASCPICLDIPAAAKITRCGHVYCWSCILHYLALSDKSWRKCPICYEAVHKNDLKSVITMAFSTYNVGEEITFKLMKRDRGSLLPIPVEECNKKVVNGLLSLNETDIDTTYSKLLLSKPEDVLSIIQMERMELNNQLTENEGCPEICFIEQALDLLNEREESIKKCLEKEKQEPSTEIGSDIDLACALDSTLLLHKENQLAEGPRQEDLSGEVETTTEDYSISCAEDLEISNSITTKPFYFYQASDGQHVYLHALNIKMLEMQYGTLENCPHEIHGNIIEKEGGSMTKGLRNRLRYLQHLPLTCQFDVAEIEIKSYVSDEVLNQFKSQIETRVKRRNRRAREERKREKKINDEVNSIWGRRKPPPKLRINSRRQFPLCGSSPDDVLSAVPPSPAESNSPSRSESFNSLSSTSTNLDSIFDSVSNQIGTGSSPEHSGPSFAEMLKEGTNRNYPRQPSRLEGEKNYDRQEVTVDSEGELEGYVPVPNFSHSFSDAIAMALEKANFSGDDKSNKKKKKKKQKVLFVNGMACSAK